MLEDAAREFVVASDALDENRFANDWMAYHVRFDHAQKTLWAACGRVEGWPELEPEDAT